ncbi:MAG: hypothetical protein KJO04_08765 [Bacteroidia bacterium]|nr:hypothetical protein [Bacteroidia bacterium]
MKTSEFLSLLNEHQNRRLIFEYQPGKLVNKKYHITEIKNIKVDSVDCGAKTDTWNETVIQLWESPVENEDRDYLSIYKVLGILNKVDRMRAMDREAVVKFEYSNAHFHTSQLDVTGYDLVDGKLKIALYSQPTDCKAKDDCGVSEEVTATASSRCEPESGCC